jgi:hypothetical protein
VQTAAVEVGALGIGALLTTTLDVTGILSAGALAIAGFYILPYRRSQVKKDLREKVAKVRKDLSSTLQGKLLPPYFSLLIPFSKSYFFFLSSSLGQGVEFGNISSEKCNFTFFTVRTIRNLEIERSRRSN